MHKYSLIYATITAILLTSHVTLAKTKKPVAQAPLYPECAHRDPSVSEEECRARLDLTEHWKPLAECKGLYGAEYRTCAVKVPHQATAIAAQTTEQNARPILPSPREAVLSAQINAANHGRTLSPAEIDETYHAAEKAEQDAIKSGHSELVASDRIERVQQGIANEERAKQSSQYCSQMTAGASREVVYGCLGVPDHTNSDIYNDQLVYPNGTYVYIDKTTDRVTNIQWTR